MIKNVILAGGCFWCVEHDLREAPGVISVTSGYSGGESTSPTYENHEGHREVVLVEYDDTKTSYKKLLQYFIDRIDPTDTGGQFGDRGEAYRTAIYFENEEERTIAKAVLHELNESNIYEKSSAVDIIQKKLFYKAEEYHQNYAEKNAFQYSLYRKGSGREDFVQRTCEVRDEKHLEWSA